MRTSVWMGESWKCPGRSARRRLLRERGAPELTELEAHSRLLIESYRRVVGGDLLAQATLETPEMPHASTDSGRSTSAQFGESRAEALSLAPFAVVSHGGQAEPIFNYGNALALHWFEISWQALCALPSRHSAEPAAQAEREQLLSQVSQHGYIENYRGVRISAEGRRFWIEEATVWNVVDEAGVYRGQAACFAAVRPVSTPV